MIRVFMGFDQREAIAYHVCAQSIIEKTGATVAFTPLGGIAKDGSNVFGFSRYLVPALCDYRGWAVFMDGDMVVDFDIAELMSYADETKAIVCVKHAYSTKHPRKYIGSDLESPNVDYPRKNWSSVVLWNCGHPANRVLTNAFITEKSSMFLHRLQWLRDEEIGALPADWNFLVGESAPGPAHLYHYTLGLPALRHYTDVHKSWKWHSALLRALECAGEYPDLIVKRAQERVGELQ